MQSRAAGGSSHGDPVGRVNRAPTRSAIIYWPSEDRNKSRSYTNAREKSSSQRADFPERHLA